VDVEDVVKAMAMLMDADIESERFILSSGIIFIKRFLPSWPMP